MRILVVEDEERIAAGIRRALEREGYDVAAAECVSEALILFQSWSPDMVLLDLMLPDGDGMDVASQIRQASDIPVVVITSLGREEDTVAALDKGADDYLVKPFGIEELLARIRAVARRGERRPERRSRLAYGSLELDEPSRHVSVDGEAVELSRREFDILRMLLERPGQVTTRSVLSQALWGLPVSRAGKTLDVHVSSLRRKLGDDPSRPRFIETVRGIGFRLFDPGENEDPAEANA